MCAVFLETRQLSSFWTYSRERVVSMDEVTRGAAWVNATNTTQESREGTRNESHESALPARWQPGAGNPRVDLAVAAWLHAKFQRSGSVKTRAVYTAFLGEFRAALAMDGL